MSSPLEDAIDAAVHDYTDLRDKDAIARGAGASTSPRMRAALDAAFGRLLLALAQHLTGDEHLSLPDVQAHPELLTIVAFNAGCLFQERRMSEALGFDSLFPVEGIGASVERP